jgi:hypothetical protein
VLLHDKIVRLRAPLIAAGYGNTARDWSSASSQPYLVHWSATGGTEAVGDQPQTDSKVKILGDEFFDLEATDRIVGPDGLTYEVDGEVLRSYRRGQLHHVRAFLQRVATKD